MRRVHPDGRRAAGEGRAAARIAADVSAVTSVGTLGGAADAHATAVVTAALATLERLADLGWRAVVGDTLGTSGHMPAGPRALGGDAVAERTEAFDPLAAFDR
jgi:hypothetical protein